MNKTAKEKKQRVYIRMDPELVDLLENVSRERGTLYFDRDRTWLIEHAVKQQYGFLISNKETVNTQ